MEVISNVNAQRSDVRSIAWLDLRRVFTLRFRSKDVHEALLAFPHACDPLPSVAREWTEIRNEPVRAKVMMTGDSLNVLEESKCDNLLLLRMPTLQKLFGKLEDGRQTRGVAARVGIDDKVCKLGNVVVVAGWLAVPVCDVVIPARLKGRTRFKKARDD